MVHGVQLGRTIDAWRASIGGVGIPFLARWRAVKNQLQVRFGSRQISKLPRCRPLVNDDSPSGEPGVARNHGGEIMVQARTGLKQLLSNRAPRHSLRQRHRWTK